MKPDLVFGDVVLRRGVHIMVVDPKPAEKKGSYVSYLAGMQLSRPGAVSGLLSRAPEIAFYNRGECKKVEDGM